MNEYAAETEENISIIPGVLDYISNQPMQQICSNLKNSVFQKLIG
jgi:hypothetical protein